MRLETITLAALTLRAWAASVALPVVAVDTGSKLSSEVLGSMPKAVLSMDSVTPVLAPASIRVDRGEITLALAGALKTLVTRSPVEVSTVLAVDRVTKDAPAGLAPTRLNLPSLPVMAKGSSPASSTPSWSLSSTPSPSLS